MARRADPAAGPDEGPAFDWFHLLDMAVWFAVFVIGALAAEWLVGYLVRERIARGADRYLAKVTPGQAEPTTG